MARKTAAQLARDKRLAAGRDKKLGKSSAPNDPSEPTSPPDTGSPPESGLLQTSPALPDIDNRLPESPAPEPQPLETLIAGLDLEDLGPNPEDLPFEDPEEEVDASPNGPEENDEWWDGASDAGDFEKVEENCAIRIDNQPIPREEQAEMIAELDKVIEESFEGRGRDKRSTLDELTLTRIRLMAATLRLGCKRKLGLIESSKLAADAAGKSEWAATATRRRIRVFRRTQMLPANLYGRHNESVVKDESLSAALKKHLREVGRYVKARNIIDFFHTPKANKFTHLISNPPTLRTAQNWMHTLGYEWGVQKRGMFVDGHERPDVVEFRDKKFLPVFTELEQRMRSWNKYGKEIPPKLKPGEKVVVGWWQDESVFKALDRTQKGWSLVEGEKPGISKKGDGASGMVSDVFSPDHGWLKWLRARLLEKSDIDKLPIDELTTDDEARVLFRPGKERDGYFSNKEVCEQLVHCMKIITEEWPEEEHVIFVDNATTHSKLPEDTPIASRLTLGPSRKVWGEKTGSSGEKIKVKLAPAKFADGSPQELYYPADHPKPELRGAFKGLAKLLEERKIPGARKMRLQCPKKSCKSDGTNCCARTTMANQPDFQNQKSILEILGEKHGCRIIFLPKFHCELNPIEQCWGMAKRVYREYPTSSTEADLLRNMVTSLGCVRLDSMRKFAARSRRFVHAYRVGLVGLAAAWAVKHFKSHRTITEAAFYHVDGPDGPEHEYSIPDLSTYPAVSIP